MISFSRGFQRSGSRGSQFAVFAVIIVVIIRSQPVRDAVDMPRLRGSLWPPLAMATGFAISIPLYLIVGQSAFAAWAAAPILVNLILGQLQRRRHAGANRVDKLMPQWAN